MMTKYKLDVIVPAHGRLDLTMKCLNALYSNTTLPFHLIVVDDSTDLTPLYMADLKKQFDNLTYIHSDVPYKSGNQIFNIGLANSVTPFAATVMNIMMVEPDWELTAMELMANNPKVGVIGFKCLMPDGTIESAGIRMQKWLPCDIGRGFPSHRLSSIYEVDAAQWAFALLRKEAVGKLEEDVFHGFKGVDDIDNCFVVKRAGWSIFVCGLGVGYHSPRATRGSNTEEAQRLNAENMEIFYKRWGFWDDFQAGVKGVTDADLIHLSPKVPA